jgi:ribonuclease HI
MKEVKIWTDGACSGNPGPGGWAAILVFGTQEAQVSGSVEHTTNQRMELEAAVHALEKLNQPCKVILHSDSAYLINAFKNGWVDNWQRNGWLTAKEEPVKNDDLWKLLITHCKKHTVQFVKVKGHSGDHYNELADHLAVKALKELKEVLA